MACFRRLRGRFMVLAAAASLVGIMAGCGGSDSPPPATQQNTIVIGDFNADGKPDMAVTTMVAGGPGIVGVFLQIPTIPGSFYAPTYYGVGNDPFQVASADLNGDGLPDLAVADTGSDTVSVLLNNPSRPGSFLPAVAYACGPAPISVAVGDLDRDGFPDIAVSVADGVDILFQNPASPGTFVSTLGHLPLANGAFSVAIGDLDGDAIPDIAASGLDAVDIFFQQPASPGIFATPVAFAAGVQPNGIAIADIDGDGLLDLAVANIGSSVDGSGASISILIQDPVTAGNFLPVNNFAVANGARDLAVGDLNGDGFPDLAVASVVFQSPNPGIISILQQSPAAPGNFVLSATKRNGFTPQSVAIDDLNGDLRLDIAIQDGPSILYQDPAQPGVFFDEVVIGP